MTTLFSEDFETADLAAWTTTYGGVAVQSAITHTGQYACSASIASGHRTNYLTKNCASQTSAYIRFYVHFNSFPAGTCEFLIARFSFSASRPLVTVYSDGASTRWRLRDGAGTARTYADGPTLQTWYCVELKAVVDDESALYINGEKILSGTAPSGSSASIYMSANHYSGTSDGADLTFDDILYSDTYNGPQNRTQTVNDSLSIADPQLCSKQLLTLEYISATEKAIGDKSLTAIDQVAYQEAASTSKNLSIQEDLCLSEAATIGVKGHVKTKLFLFLADLAVQLTGD